MMCKKREKKEIGEVLGRFTKFREWALEVNWEGKKKGSLVSPKAGAELRLCLHPSPPHGLNTYYEEGSQEGLVCDS